jgi:sulfur-oxidizing protein SoxA
MLAKITKTSILLATAAACTLSAGDFNVQAEKDRKALVKYFEDKFADPEANRYDYFPYSTDEELKSNIAKGLKFEDFALGNYAFNKVGKASYDEIKEMPPYEDNIDAGEELYNGSEALQKCFPEPADAVVKYPYFDETKKEVVTLTGAINSCLTTAGEKKWNENKGKMADFQAYMVAQAAEAEKVINVTIPSAAAQAAYESGKEFYYSQRGYLKLSCANCHVQGAGKRVRNEALSQLLGQTTHFPVYRLKWQGLGTLERRLSGCVKDQGQNPIKSDSKEMKEMIYFMSYMSNGLKIDGPDIRK